MRKILPALPCLLLVTTVPAAAGTVRTLERTEPVRESRSVDVRFSVGDLRVRPSDDGAIHATVDVDCSSSSRRCREDAKEITLEVRRAGGTLILEVEGFPHFGCKGLSTDVRLAMPRGLDLKVDTGVADVEIEGITGDVEVDVGVGDVDVRTLAAGVRSVDLDAGVGDVSLSVDGHSIEGTGFVGKGLKWHKGTGEARIEIDCGVGDIEVELD